MTRPAGPPQFATVLRGYDREQVDEYVAALQEFLQEAQERAASAHRVVDGSSADAGAGGEDAVTDILVLTPTARAVQGLPQRLAEAVRDALDAAERAGQAALAEVEHERESLTEQARAARELARQEADALVGQAQGDAERLVREATEEADRRRRDAAEQSDRQVREAAEQAERRLGEAAAEADELLRRGREQDRRAQLAAEDELTSVRQRAEQEQARHDHIVRQIEVLRQWLDGPTRPDQGGLARSLFGSEPAAAAERPAAPEHIDLDAAERSRGERAPTACVRRPADDEAATDVLDTRPALAASSTAPPTGHSTGHSTGHPDEDQDADPYGDRTQVLRIVE